MPSPSVRARPPFPVLDALLALVCAALAAWVHRSALHVYFHPDDLISLERARGIVPTPELGFWRLIAGPGFFMAAVRLFGADPFAYHALNATLHAVSVVLLYAFVRSRGGAPIAATLAAGLFGAARPAFSVLQQAVGIGDLLACACVIGALLLADRAGTRARVTAVALALAALLSKESVLLLPLVLLVPVEPGRLADRDAWRARVLRTWPVLAACVLVGAALWAGRVPARAFGGEAYATRFGLNLFHNLMTYVSWAFDVVHPFYDERGGVSIEAWQIGIPVMGALFALAWEVRARTTLPVVGLAWFTLGLVPVLPLLHHTYANYLYAPLAGLAIALGAGLAALVPARAPTESRRAESRARRPPGAPAHRAGAIAWAVVAAVLMTHAWTSTRLLDARAARRFQGLDLPYDPQLRKSEMVRRAAVGLGQTSIGPPRRIALFSPPEMRGKVDDRTGETRQDSLLSVEHTLIYQVLDGGRALRALFPTLDSVAFVPHWSAAYADFDLCANSFEGDIMNFGRGPDALLRLAEILLQAPDRRLAADFLTRACEIYPSDRRLAVALATARDVSATQKPLPTASGAPGTH